MPNWSFNTYKCVGDVKEILDLNNKLMELDNMKEPLVPNGFGNLWLGCLVKILGGDVEKVYCRGDITEFSYNEEDEVLTIDTQTAWAEMNEVRHFLEQLYPGLEIYYYSEEGGCEIYETNDKHGRFFPQRFILDDLDGEGPEYYDDIDSLLKAASEIFGKELDSMADLNEAIEESDCFSLHCVNVVDD